MNVSRETFESLVCFTDYNTTFSIFHLKETEKTKMFHVKHYYNWWTRYCGFTGKIASFKVKNKVELVPYK